MQIVYHKNIPSIEHDGSDFIIDTVPFRIIGTERRDNGKYYVAVKNLNTGEWRNVEHTKFCNIIEAKYKS